MDLEAPREEEVGNETLGGTPGMVAEHNHEQHVHFADLPMGGNNSPQHDWHTNRGGDEVIEVVAEEIPSRRHFYQRNDAMEFEDQSAAARGMEGFYEFVMGFLVWIATLIRGLLDYGTRGNYTKIFGGKVSVANGEVIVNQQPARQNAREDEERRNSQMARKAHTLNELREDLKNVAKLRRLPHSSGKNGSMNKVLFSRIMQKEATVKELERVLAMGTTVDGLKERSQHTKEFLTLTTMNTKALRNNLRGLNDEVADRVREELETVKDEYKDIEHAMGSFDTNIMTLEDMGEEDLEQALQEYLDEDDWEPTDLARNRPPVIPLEVQSMVFTPQVKITPLPPHLIHSLQNQQHQPNFAPSNQAQPVPPQSNPIESNVVSPPPLEIPKPTPLSLATTTPINEMSHKPIIARVSGNLVRDVNGALPAKQPKSSDGPTKIKIPSMAPKVESPVANVPEPSKPVIVKPKLKVLQN